MSNVSSSNYMYRKLNKESAFSVFYAGKQEAFIAAGARASEEVAKTILNNFQKENLFTQCIDLCAKKRKKHAQRVKERGWSDFGKMRVLSSSFADRTIMCDLRYFDYGVKLIEKIQKIYRDQILEDGLWEFKPISNRETTFSLREISAEEINRIQNAYLPKFKEDEIEIRDGEECYNRKYKENHPNEYRDEVMKDSLEKLDDLEKVGYSPPDENTRYLHAIARLQMTDPEDGKEKRFATSQYLFRVDLSQDREVREFCAPLIIHQDVFLVPILQKEAERWFDKAIQWSSEREEKDLKESVGRMVYCLSHAMPYHRGTAAIIEWLEAGIYRYHRFKDAKTSDQVMMNLEALTSLSLEEFLDSYYEYVELGDKEN